MKLYEIIICNYADDTQRSEIVISDAILNKNDSYFISMLNIDFDFEYIHQIKVPNIVNIAYDEEEYNKIDSIINTLKNG